MDAEQRVPAQHFHVPVLEVEGLMLSYGRGVYGKLIVRGIRDCGVGGRLVIESICDREVGEGGDADRRRLSGWSDGRRRNCVWLWDGDRFEGRGLRDLRIDISIWKSEGRDDGGCGRVSPVRTSRPWFPGREYRWGREALPPTPP